MYVGISGFPNTILLPPVVITSVEHDDVDYVNMMIETQSPDRRAPHQPAPTPITQRRPLTSEQRRNNIVNAYNDYIDTINFLYMPRWGCIHLRSEWLLSTKHNTRPPQSFIEAHGPCNNMCYICKRTHNKWMLPIIYKGTVEFLETAVEGSVALRDHTRQFRVIDGATVLV